MASKNFLWLDLREKVFYESFIRLTRKQTITIDERENCVYKNHFNKRERNPLNFENFLHKKKSFSLRIEWLKKMVEIYRKFYILQNSFLLRFPEDSHVLLSKFCIFFFFFQSTYINFSQSKSSLFFLQYHLDIWWSERKINCTHFVEEIKKKKRGGWLRWHVVIFIRKHSKVNKTNYNALKMKLQ